jgi:transcription elongation factor Elf1
MKKLKKPPMLKKWYQCPYCKKNAVIYDNTAKCNGVFFKCKECKREFEIRI